MKNFEIKNIDCHAALAMTKNAQSGRSMIEMLGVLAIIGVLSVGGIAGYSKAMTKYRINKTIEQITLIAGNVRTFFAPQRNYSGLDYTILKKAKLVPDEMWNSSKTAMENVFGGATKVGILPASYGSKNQEFFAFVSNIPQEACIELLTKDWTDSSVYAIANSRMVGSINPSDPGGLVANGLKIYYKNCVNSSTNGGGVNGSVICSSTLPLDTAITWCSSSDNNGFSLLFH